MTYDDGTRALHEAIGHMSMLAAPHALAGAARQVREGGDLDVAAHLLRWADLHACSPTMLDFEDRRRHWPSLVVAIDEADEDDDDELVAP